MSLWENKITTLNLLPPKRSTVCDSEGGEESGLRLVDVLPCPADDQSKPRFVQKVVDNAGYPDVKSQAGPIGYLCSLKNECMVTACICL